MYNGDVSNGAWQKIKESDMTNETSNTATETRNVYPPQHCRETNTYLTEEVSYDESCFANAACGTDTIPFEIIKIKNERTIIVREMSATKLPWKMEVIEGGFCCHVANQDEQRWKIESDERYACQTIRKAKNGNWYGKGGMHRGQKHYLSTEPRKKHDYNF